MASAVPAFLRTTRRKPWATLVSHTRRSAFTMAQIRRHSCAKGVLATGLSLFYRGWQFGWIWPYLGQPLLGEPSATLVEQSLGRVWRLGQHYRVWQIMGRISPKSGNFGPQIGQVAESERHVSGMPAAVERSASSVRHLRSAGSKVVTVSG